MPAFFLVDMLVDMKAALEQARARIETGFASQSRGDARAARRAYEDALRLVPEHPTALQLLGLLARQDGELQRAHDLMRRSLAVHPAQPHVWNNLANTLEDLAQPEAALECLGQALALQPDYGEALYNRARLLWSLGQAAQARSSLEAALQATQGAMAGHWRLLSQMQVAEGALAAGLQTLEEALQRLGEDAGLRHDQAVLLQRLGRHAHALAAHHRAKAMGLDATDAHYNRGNTLQSLGRLIEAEQSYLEALQRDPLHALAHYDLARLRWRLARPDWLNPLQAAAMQARQDRPALAAELFGLQAQLLWRAEQPNEALLAYRAAFDCAARPEHRDGIARCLVRCGHREEGLNSHRLAVEMQPSSAALWASWATSLIVAGRPHDAQAPALEAVRLAPQDQYAWALLSLVWRATEPAKAQPLLSTSLMKVVDVPTPPGYSGPAEFHADLMRELAALHIDHREPVDQTLRGGTQTLGNLFEADQPAISSLRQAMTSVIDEWVHGLRPQADHPLLARANGPWRYTDSWSSRLQPGGRHTNHVHPHGWISAVYYVEVPPACDDAARQEGWLQFGQPEADMANGFPALHAMAPKVGRLVLFPSYWWHGTKPFADTRARTTVAFDLVPA